MGCIDCLISRSLFRSLLWLTLLSFHWQFMSGEGYFGDLLFAVGIQDQPASKSRKNLSEYPEKVLAVRRKLPVRLPCWLYNSPCNKRLNKLNKSDNPGCLTFYPIAIGYMTSRQEHTPTGQMNLADLDPWHSRISLIFIQNMMFILVFRVLSDLFCFNRFCRGTLLSFSYHKRLSDFVPVPRFDSFQIISRCVPLRCSQ